MTENLKGQGLSEAEMEKRIAQMEAAMANYDNPFFRIPITFTEIFPVALIVTLVSAAILRNPKVLPARG